MNADRSIQIGDSVWVRVKRGYIGRVYDMTERFLYVETPFKSTPRRAAVRAICQLVDGKLEPQLFAR